MVTISKTRLQALVTAAWLNRAMIAVVYIWFGFLKVIGTSPAEGLVTKLFNLTLEPIMGIQTFLLILGIGECLIGFVWLSPRLTKLAFGLMIVHMFTTFMPILFLPNETWQSFFTLTLTGQYIIKNVVLLSAAWFVYVLNEE
ncbi:MAG: hypothetical protein NTX34_03595 [Cytophagales bacterium]|nr:hypothetical protein [Cytophagales bacterium]